MSKSEVSRRYYKAHDHGFYLGCIVGAAIVAWGWALQGYEIRQEMAACRRFFEDAERESK